MKQMFDDDQIIRIQYYHKNNFPISEIAKMCSTTSYKVLKIIDNVIPERQKKRAKVLQAKRIKHRTKTEPNYLKNKLFARRKWYAKKLKDPAWIKEFRKQQNHRKRLSRGYYIIKFFEIVDELIKNGQNT